jgi:hypothetical protein
MISSHPTIISGFPAFAALDSEPTDSGGEGLEEAAEPAQREKTQPGFNLSELSPPPGAVPKITAFGSPVAVSMAPVTLKGPVPPLVLSSPIAPAVPGDFDAPVTPIVFGEPVAPGAPIAVAPVDAEAIVDSAWRDTGEGAVPALPASVAPFGLGGLGGLGPLVAPIPLGSPIAPATEAGAAGERGGIPLETVPYPAVRARLMQVKRREETPEPPAMPIPTPEPAELEWLPAEPIFENRPPPATPILLVQPTVLPSGPPKKLGEGEE